MSFLDMALAQSAALDQLTLCMVEDVPDEQLAEQPGGLPNHPAWVLGHLTYGKDKVGRRFGAAMPRAASWYAPYEFGSRPSSTRADYPGKDELVAALEDAGDRLRRIVRDAGAARLDEPIADAEVALYFPTLGHSAAYILLCEGSYHAGQLSAWRRAKGLPSVFDLEGTDERLVVQARSTG